jgi:hypothetical protein
MTREELVKNLGTIARSGTSGAAIGGMGLAAGGGLASTRSKRKHNTPPPPYPNQPTNQPTKPNQTKPNQTKNSFPRVGAKGRRHVAHRPVWRRLLLGLPGRRLGRGRDQGQRRQAVRFCCDLVLGFWFFVFAVCCWHSHLLFKQPTAPMFNPLALTTEKTEKKGGSGPATRRAASRSPRTPARTSLWGAAR